MNGRRANPDTPAYPMTFNKDDLIDMDKLREQRDSRFQKDVLKITDRISDVRISTVTTEMTSPRKPLFAPMFQEPRHTMLLLDSSDKENSN